MQIDNPLISIITPTLNSSKYLRKTIDSVKNQSYQNFEHIFIDGGSTDNTISIIKQYSEKSRIISEPDKGISDAFNKGIRLAKGAIVGIINSDDYYAENIFQDIINAYLNSDKFSILHGSMCLIAIKKKRFIKPRPFPKLTFYIDMPVYHPSVFVPKKIYDDIGIFDLKYKYSMDFDFLLRASKKGYKFKNINKIVSYFRFGGLANTNALKCHKEVLNSQLGNNLNPLVCRTTYLLKVGVNRFKQLFK